MFESQATSYDDVQYPSLSFQHSHPDQLAMLATLLGLQQPLVTRCRVLELGCASGGNILPMAASLPESEFVGIDLSAGQIATGQATIDQLGLTNIQLIALNILDFPAELGQFDYIIAHGIYSWVPFVVRDQMLAICRRHLAPQGVAYISYNTYPGGRMLKPLREILLHHVRRLSHPIERAQAARTLLTLLADSERSENPPYDTSLRISAGFIKRTLAQIGPAGDSYILHDLLEDVNDPVYFHEFTAHAERHGLQYLTEAEFSSVLMMNLPPQLSEALSTLAHNLVELEQYTDFVRNRMFRMTLLCHENLDINRRLRPERIQPLYIASHAEPVALAEGDPPAGAEQFRSSDNKLFTTDHPLTIAAMHYLYEQQPRAIAFRELVRVALARLAIPPSDPHTAAQEAQVLAANLLKGFCHSASLVELHAYAPACVVEPGEYPIAAPLTRLQARDGAIITNSWHERVQLDEVNRYLLQQMDGTRTRSQLVDLLEELVGEGTLRLRMRAGELLEATGMGDRAKLAEMLDETLTALARKALLIV